MHGECRDREGWDRKRWKWEVAMEGDGSRERNKCSDGRTNIHASTTGLLSQQH
jgi:hypothetical protein